MQEIRKFPYSDYDVVLVDKDEILKTIDENIIDKDVATELIGSLEVKVCSALKEHKWCGIPYLGSIRVSDISLIKNTDEFKTIKRSAYNTMEKQAYIAFIKDFSKLNQEKINYRSMINAVIQINKNKPKFKKWYNEMIDKKGIHYANVMLASRALISPMIPYYEREILEQLEQQEDEV